jgi:hypothetical protein
LQILKSKYTKKPFKMFVKIQFISNKLSQNGFMLTAKSSSFVQSYVFFFCYPIKTCQRRKWFSILEKLCGVVILSTFCRIILFFFRSTWSAILKISSFSCFEYPKVDQFGYSISGTVFLLHFYDFTLALPIKRIGFMTSYRFFIDFLIFFHSPIVH